MPQMAGSCQETQCLALVLLLRLACVSLPPLLACWQREPVETVAARNNAVSSIVRGAAQAQHDLQSLLRGRRCLPDAWLRYARTRSTLPAEIQAALVVFKCWSQRPLTTGARSFHVAAQTDMQDRMADCLSQLHETLALAADGLACMFLRWGLGGWLGDQSLLFFTISIFRRLRTAHMSAEDVDAPDFGSGCKQPSPAFDQSAVSAEPLYLGYVADGGPPSPAHLDDSPHTKNYKSLYFNIAKNREPQVDLVSHDDHKGHDESGTDDDLHTSTREEAGC